MLFNSLEFLFLFLPITLAAASVLRGKPLLVFLCGASAAFYAFAGHLWFLAPMFITSTLDWWIGLRIEASSSPAARRGYLVASLTANLGLLMFFKYGGLFAGHRLSWVILPAGISFYTFQTISYVVDVYRGHGRARHDYFSYLGFVTFFPHLVAGPLTRHDQLVPQLEAIARDGVSPHRRISGVYLFAIGLIKKVLIADQIVHVVDDLVNHINGLGMSGAWIALLGFAMQIYFDFSGYSDMAIGLGRLFGVELPQNFNSPYLSTSPGDFWRRWHITLSRWLRDYLYISLGGNRKSEFRTRVNLMVTMALGGLWHGASWTFMIWGIYHGLLLVCFKALGERWDQLSTFVRRSVTFLLVLIGWIPFRATDFHMIGAWCAALVGRNGLGGEIGDVSRMPLLAAALAIVWLAPNSSQLDLEAPPPATTAALGFAFSIAIVFMTGSSRFLYFQF